MGNHNYPSLKQIQKATCVSSSYFPSNIEPDSPLDKNMSSSMEKLIEGFLIYVEEIVRYFIKELEQFFYFSKSLDSKVQDCQLIYKYLCRPDHLNLQNPETQQQKIKLSLKLINHLQFTHYAKEKLTKVKKEMKQSTLQLDQKKSKILTRLLLEREFNEEMIIKLKEQNQGLLQQNYQLTEMKKKLELKLVSKDIAHIQYIEKITKEKFPYLNFKETSLNQSFQEFIQEFLRLFNQHNSPNSSFSGNSQLFGKQHESMLFQSKSRIQQQI